MELQPCGTVLRYIAVGGVYLTRVVIGVVGDVRDAAALDGNQGAVAVVHVLRAVHPLVLKRAGKFIVYIKPVNILK